MEESSFYQTKAPSLRSGYSPRDNILVTSCMSSTFSLSLSLLDNLTIGHTGFNATRLKTHTFSFDLKPTTYWFNSSLQSKTYWKSRLYRESYFFTFYSFLSPGQASMPTSPLHGSCFENPTNDRYLSAPDLFGFSVAKYSPFFSKLSFS